MKNESKMELFLLLFIDEQVFWGGELWWFGEAVCKVFDSIGACIWVTIQLEVHH